MPQLFNVVLCFQCSIYQVDIDKKSTNKWQCKLCGNKQSLKQIFFQGESRDCRVKVQELNELKHQKEELKDAIKLDRIYHQSDCNNKEEGGFTYQESFNDEQPVKPKISKWAQYLNEEDYNNYMKQ